MSGWPDLGAMWESVSTAFSGEPAGAPVCNCGTQPAPEMPTIAELVDADEERREAEAIAQNWANGTPTPEMIDEAQRALVERMGFDMNDWRIYRESVAAIESGGASNEVGGEYTVAGGYNDHYDGKYQMGRVAKTSASEVLGEDDPGHTTAAREAYRGDAEMQERYFAANTEYNHNWLMANNPTYANASDEEKLGMLGYAHNQGMGGANDWINTGEGAQDGFDTHATIYPDRISEGFEARDAAEAAAAEAAAAQAAQQAAAPPPPAPAPAPAQSPAPAPAPAPQPADDSTSGWGWW